MPESSLWPTPTFLIITSCSIYALKHPRLHYTMKNGTNINGEQLSNHQPGNVLCNQCLLLIAFSVRVRNICCMPVCASRPLHMIRWCPRCNQSVWIAWHLDILSSNTSLPIVADNDRIHITHYCTLKVSKVLHHQLVHPPNPSHLTLLQVSRPTLFWWPVGFWSPPRWLFYWSMSTPWLCIICLVYLWASRTLCLSRSHRNTAISGVAGLSRSLPLQSVGNFKISPTHLPNGKFEVWAVWRVIYPSNPSSWTPRGCTWKTSI